MTKENTAQEKLDLIAASFRESNMFYTPKNKEDATKWCQLQGGELTLGFMVGLNYAAEMLKQIMDGTHPGLTPVHDPDAEVPIPAHDVAPAGHDVAPAGMRRFLTFTDEEGEVHVSVLRASRPSKGYQDFIWQWAPNALDALAQHDAKIDERNEWINAGNEEKETY